MKKLILILFAVFFSAVMWANENAPHGWETDIEAALKKADAENKNVLLLFTGSDWCGFCKKLEREVLSRKEFRQITPSKYVMVYFDFPNEKKISPEKMKIQKKWQRKFNISGYPTTVILNNKGEKVKSIEGYSGVENYLKALFPELGK